MKTILVVDDESSIVSMLRFVLSDEGYHVVTASNGQEGLALLEESRPDLVLTDLMMPILDGREMVGRMQAHPSYQSIPVVLMSAGAVMPAASQSHPTPFLRKPFQLTDLLETIERLIGSPE
ncbi:MAG: response regulator [Dehalococcoidia bacterium]